MWMACSTEFSVSSIFLTSILISDSLPQQLHQLSSQQTATRSLVVSGSSGQPPATSLLSPPIAPNSQHM
ncbi:helicase MOM1, partial [Trifolium medium]|nr:helicase MOM1 [Trifolium medium]